MLLPSAGAIKNSSRIFQPLLREIIHEAELARDNAMPPLSYDLFRQFELNGDREQYQHVYFARRERLAACAIAAMVSADPQHIDVLQETIWEICNEYTWCLPAHLGANNPVSPQQMIDLFAAETAHALAEILTILVDQIAPAIAQRIRDEIERRLFQPMCMEDVRFDWETADHNWASVCGGCVGMAAMLLIDDKERLTRILNIVIGAMESFLSGYGDDGGCSEGIGYWVYGFGYYVYFAEMLEEYSSGQWDLMNQEKVRAIAGYPEAVHLSDGVYANFSDAPERMLLPTGLLSRLSQRTDTPMPFPCVVPGFHNDSCYRWGHLSRNLWWTDEAIFKGQPKQGLQTLDHLGVIIDRRRTVAGMNVALSAKGGHNGEAHNHNDLGHFILHANGNNLLIDLGHGLYTKDYFREGRYDILNNSSAGHSVPIINGVHQAAGEAYKAVWLEQSELPNGSSGSNGSNGSNGSKLSLDLTDAYSESAGIHRYTRAFQWTCSEIDFDFDTDFDTDFDPNSDFDFDFDFDPNSDFDCRLRLEDRFLFNSFFPDTYHVEERFISYLLPVITGGTVVWQSGDVTLSLQYNEQQFTAQTQCIQHRDHENVPIIVYITSLCASSAGGSSIAGASSVAGAGTITGTVAGTVAGTVSGTSIRAGTSSASNRELLGVFDFTITIV